MAESPSSKDNESSSPVKINEAIVVALGTAVGMLILAIFAFATWKPLIVAPLVNALFFFHRITGNLGISILVLSIVINLSSFLVSVPTLRVEQKMWELEPNRQELRKRRSTDSSKMLSGLLTGVLTGIRQGLVGVASVALIWVFWYVFLPKSELSANLDKFVWSSLDPSVESFDTYFMNLDLRDRDIHRVVWSPYPLPGILVLASSFLAFLDAYLRNVIKKKHGTTLLSTHMRGCILGGGPLLALISGLIFPSGVVLYWLAGSPFWLLKLWLFPLAVVND